MHDGVYDTARALPAAQLGIHQEGSSGTAREESRQAEDRVVPQEAGAAGRGEDGGRLRGMQAVWKKFGNPVFEPAANLTVVNEIIFGGIG